MTTTEIPATGGSESTSESARWNPSHESAEIENPNKNDDDEELQRDELQGVPDWLQAFKHGLVDESVPEHREASSSSHELLLEPRANVVSGKHNIFHSLPEGQKLRYLFEDQDYKGFLQKTHWYSRAQSGKIGDLITAAQKF